MRSDIYRRGGYCSASGHGLDAMRFVPPKVWSTSVVALFSSAYLLGVPAHAQTNAPAKPPPPGAPTSVAAQLDSGPTATTTSSANGHVQIPAQESTPDQMVETVPSTKRIWYGWQTLTADAISSTLIFASPLVDESRSLIGPGIFGYLVGGPIVHFVNARVGAGFASLGVRFGMPAATYILMASGTAKCIDSNCGHDAGSVGLLLGYAGAIALDAAVLAWKRTPTQPTAGTSLVPLVGIDATGGWIGAASRF